MKQKGALSLSERFTGSVLQISLSLRLFKISGINRDGAALKRLSGATRAPNRRFPRVFKGKDFIIHIDI